MQIKIVKIHYSHYDHDDEYGDGIYNTFAEGGEWTEIDDKELSELEDGLLAINNEAHQHRKMHKYVLIAKQEVQEIKELTKQILLDAIERRSKQEKKRLATRKENKRKKDLAQLEKLKAQYESHTSS